MGYDMHWRKADDDEVLAVAAATEQFNAAVQTRNELPESEKGTYNPEKAKALGDPAADEAYDGRSPRYIAAQDQVHATYQAVHDAERSYFRLNMWGMGLYCDLMEQVGMVFEDDPHPAWPKAGDFGITDDEASAIEYPEDYPDITWTDERLVSALKYKDAQTAVLDFHGKTDTPGIPAHKFSSNDGWHVLPVEAEAAVRIWLKFVEDNGEDAARNLIENGSGGRGYDRWLSWINYLAGAAKHDGFEVH